MIFDLIALMAFIYYLFNILARVAQFEIRIRYDSPSL